MWLERRSLLQPVPAEFWLQWDASCFRWCVTEGPHPSMQVHSRGPYRSLELAREERDGLNAAIQLRQARGEHVSAYP